MSAALPRPRLDERRPKLVAFLSHPIQHYIPWFSGIAREMNDEFLVVYACAHGVSPSKDPEFGHTFSWDMDLLSGYGNDFFSSAQSARLSPTGGFRGIRFANVHAYLEKVRPEAVMIFGWLFAGYWEVAIACARLGIPYILRAESNLLNQRAGPRWWLKQRTVGRLCRGAAVCLAIGRRNADLFRAYGVRDDRILMAPYFVDNDHFRERASSERRRREGIRKEWGLPADGLVYLFMGKLIEKKHPDHLLAAWQALPPESRSRTALLFAGSGEMLDSLRETARGDGRVAFAGFLNRPRLPAAYAASDLLVLPSDEGETWGLVVNEAMASGLPAIVSDRVGCAPDLVLPDETGHVYPFGDIRRLSGYLDAASSDRPKTASMGKQAAIHVESASVSRSVDAVKQAVALCATGQPRT